MSSAVLDEHRAYARPQELALRFDARRRRPSIVIIRPLHTLADAGTERALAAFLARCFEAEYASSLDAGEMRAVRDWTADGAAREILAPGLDGALALVAWQGGRPVGTLVIADRDPCAWIWGAYVDPERLREGIGTRLLREACATLRVAATVAVIVMSGSDKAVAFWRRAGFSPTSTGTDEVFPGVRLPVSTMETSAGALRERLGLDVPA